VKAAPSLPYVGFPKAVNSSDAPDVKSTDTDRASAGSAGHPDCLVGLQLDHVCDVTGDVKRRKLVRVAKAARRHDERPPLPASRHTMVVI
jgi:hypothetical protein